jgi:choline dehydrogenase-like flavoprotein
LIFDLRHLAEQPDLAADICIVGSGPAGISLALRFATGPLEVLLLESGGFEPEPETAEFDRGVNRGEPYYDLRRPRLRALGGTSGHWSGELAILSEADFAPRPWLSRSGWPIAHAELARHYDRALEICGGSPWPRERMSEGAPLLRDPAPLGGAPWLELRHRQRSPDGPRRFGRFYRRDLEASRSVRVLLHATVTQLLATDDGARVGAAEIRSPEGRRATVRARAFVLACGGLENPRLLLLSNHVLPNGLGNRHDQVGRCFQEHPVVGLGRVSGPRDRLEPLRHRLEGRPILLRDLCPTREFASRERALQFQLELTPARGRRARNRRGAAGEGRRVADDAADILPWLTGEADAGLPGTAAPGPAALTRAAASVMLEMEPDPESRVTLGEERDAFGNRVLALDIRLNDALRRSVCAAARALVRELGRFSAGTVELSPEADAANRGERFAWRGARHHIGATRMADDPTQGVVDRDCRIHGVENLWVAGSSVFPCAGYVNPTVTLVALALRLADHLVARLR